MSEESYDFDVVVIGGGSGGLACAKECAKLGARTVLFDFVKPSPQGTSWGLGGTCVNVGCIPKKLLHNAARMRMLNHHSGPSFGFSCADDKPRWETAISSINDYIRSLNFSYRSGLLEAGVKYIRASASFVNEHTLSYEEAGTSKQLTAKFIIISIGGRPYIPESAENAVKYAISSDDLFWRHEAPGKTLIIGGGYIGLESAGFLKEFGFEVKVVVRSRVLNGFDRQCSEKIASLLEQSGVEFYYKRLPTKLEKLETNRILVTFSDGATEEFDTVMYAVGRRVQTADLCLDNTRVRIHESDLHKICVNENDQTDAENIFAIGDAALGRPELTPVAIRSGELLARRLFGGSTQKFNYRVIPTVVFTPFEYGCVGLSEEAACELHGEDNIEVYLSEFNSLEVSATHWKRAGDHAAGEYPDDLDPVNLSKLIVHRTTGELLGFHCIGLHAGETTQGYALAFRLGAKFSDFRETISIHPTDAESFHQLSVTKRSKLSWVASGGCGGGSCG